MKVSIDEIMSMKYLAIVGFGVLVAAFGGYVLGLGTSRQALVSEQTGGGRVVVTTSFYPLYYFASVIGGDKADVRNLTPAGVEPHDFEPTSGDIARIEKGDLLIINGGVESWGNKIRELLRGTDVKVVVAGDGLFGQNMVEEGKTSQDPHVWLDPLLAKKEAGRILEGFISIDPSEKPYFQANAERLDGELDGLNRSYRSGLARCPQRDIVTSHAAFGYLAKAYGLTQAAIAGLSPDVEPSVRDMAEVVKMVRQKGIKYIFFESLISPKISQAIADEVGARTLVLNPIEGLTEEQLKAGENYLTVMRENLANLRKALGCN